MGVCLVVRQKCPRKSVSMFMYMYVYVGIPWSQDAVPCDAASTSKTLLAKMCISWPSEHLLRKVYVRCIFLHDLYILNVMALNR